MSYLYFFVKYKESTDVDMYQLGSSVSASHRPCERDGCINPIIVSVHFTTKRVIVFVKVLTRISDYV